MSIRVIQSKRRGLRYKALVRDSNGAWMFSRTHTRKSDAGFDQAREYNDDYFNQDLNW
jgi:hypothetical protein